MLGKKILCVTGASSGIGSVLITHFVDKVLHLFTANRRTLAEFSPWQSIPANLSHIPSDLTQEVDVAHLFQFIAQKYGRLDILINCVGRSLYSHLIEDFPEDEFDEVIDINLRSAFLLTKHAIKLMKRTGGNIVHFVSSSAKNISPKKAPYGSAKAGLAHFIHYAASEAGDYNIKVNGISPTYVFTPRHEEEIDAKSEKFKQSRNQIIHDILATQILKRPLYPQDLIAVTELLATTNTITGQIYNCSMGEILGETEQEYHLQKKKTLKAKKKKK